MKKFYFIFFLLFYTVKSSAQIIMADGYLITSNYDTISGKLEYFSNGYADRCIISRDGSNTLEFYSPDQIKEYHIIKNFTYHSFFCNQKKLLLKLVSQGKVNLYSYKEKLYIKDTSGECIKLLGGERTVSANGVFYSYNAEGYKFQLKQFIPDSTLFDEIDKLPFDNDAITMFVRKYNNEADSNYLVKTKKNYQNFGILAGYSKSSFVMNKQLNFVPDIRELLTGRWENDHDMKLNIPYLGANYRLYLGQESSFLSFGINFGIIGKQSFSQVLSDLSDAEVKFFTGTTPSGQPGIHTFSLHNEFKMNATSIAIPVDYHWVFLYGRFRPFVDAGISARIFPDHNASLTQIIYQDDEHYYTITDQPSLDLLYAGVRIGPGFNYLINMYSALSGGLILDYCMPVSEDPAFTKIKSVSFYLSYNFTKK